ncbi:MAG: pyridoxal-phosphate dependent enzyme [Chromatiales bacterium]|nr:MAG: pyridoxal-phosphate dependent enzyme [Chromatiales bacterium]
MTLLTDRYPALFATLPYLQLAELPTPLDDADRMASELGIRRLWIKRDDVCAQPYGGNKVRKLEHLLADALQKGCDAVLTYGAAGSNHALATSIYAHRVGVDCYAVMTPQASTPKVADTLRYHALLGTKMVAAKGFQETVTARDAVMANHPTGGSKIYDIWWGGSSWVGATGFVNAALEIGEQLARDPPDYLYVAAGTQGTAAGLALGLRLLGWQTQVVGVRVVPMPTRLPAAYDRLFRETGQELHALDGNFPIVDEPFANFELRDEFLGDGYAIPTDGTTEAVEMAQKLASIGLETTYTGKAMDALVQDARSGRLADSSVVFWLTYNSHPYPPEIADYGVNDVPAEFRSHFE